MVEICERRGAYMGDEFNVKKVYLNMNVVKLKVLNYNVVNAH
jgi:hypothetical protein